MRVVRHAAEIAPATRAVVAVGVFDGVHAGHREIIDRVVRRAAATSATPAVLTFEPHPRSVLKPLRSSRVLTPLCEKLRILDRLGVGMTAVIAFDRALAAMGAEEFVDAWLAGPFDLCGVVVGYDFRLGREREGNAATLAKLGATKGFDVETVAPFVMGAAPVKSTRIRDEIAAGNVAEAASLLMRFHSLRGGVVGGDARGRSIGFPTANLSVNEAEKLWPADGVYAVFAETRLGLARAVAHLGVRPTFGPGGERRLEVHLLEACGELEGAPMAAHFVARIREERRFPAPSALAEEIGRDCETARGILGRADERFVFTRL
jgi:riboflavin kinase/FMN adenylyltransferase